MAGPRKLSDPGVHRDGAASSTAAAIEWRLWSTTARLVVTDPVLLDDASTLVFRHLAEVERAASRFHAGSELLRLNAGSDTSSGTREVQVSPMLADLLGEALLAAERSDGAVDPTVGASLVAAGYDRDIAVVRRRGRCRTGPDSGVAGRPVPPLRFVPAAGWQRLHLRRTAAGGTLRLPAACRLDLGATAKAAAADRCAQLVATRLGVGCLVSLGGDIATAGAGPDGGWQVRIADDRSDGDAHDAARRADEASSRILLADGVGLATSSTRRRRWRRGRSEDGQPDAEMHHLLVPGTGAPTRTPWPVVSTVAASCVEANTASTAAIVKGSAGGRWLAGTGLPGRLVAEDGSVTLVGGWPREGVAA